jgi:LysR family glycine cleavage system transcriptional activator
LSSVKERTVKQSITLDVDPELAQSWLVARLPALLGALAGTSLTVLSTPRYERSAFERVDIALRYGYGEWEGFENALICGDRLTAVGSPALLEARGLSLPLTAEQVLDLPLLGYTKRSWIPWLTAAGMPAVEPDAVAVFDNAAGLIAAASAGVGAGLARGLLAADAQREGRLVELTQVEIPTHYNLYAVWPREKAARVAPLIDVIRELVAQAGSPR